MPSYSHIRNPHKKGSILQATNGTTYMKGVLCWITWSDWSPFEHTMKNTYRKISNLRPTKSKSLYGSRISLYLSLLNPLKPGVRPGMKAAPTGGAPTTSEWSQISLPLICAPYIRCLVVLCNNLTSLLIRIGLVLFSCIKSFICSSQIIMLQDMPSLGIHTTSPDSMAMIWTIYTIKESRYMLMVLY